jgi:sugar-specific transcriptional regulator TrmB
VADLLIQKKVPMMIDEISHLSTLPQGQLASVLLGMEFKNLVRALPGKQYQWID